MTWLPPYIFCVQGRYPFHARTEQWSHEMGFREEILPRVLMRNYALFQRTG